MAHEFGLQTASGHLTVSEASKEPYPADVEERFRADAAEVIARYPHPRSALLPLLHLVQSVDGYVTGRGIDLCAELLDLTTAEVSGVATFYTQFKRHPNGEYTVGVCTNTLCAVMGGDEIWDAVSAHLGVGHDETTDDGKITLERVECNAACDYAPVVMTNWEFFDNQTPASTVDLVDDLRAGRPVAPTRGPSRVCTFKEVSRVLAGFHDGLADEGVGAGPASLVGLRLAHEQGWTAPEGASSTAAAPATTAPGTPATTGTATSAAGTGPATSAAGTGPATSAAGTAAGTGTGPAAGTAAGTGTGPAATGTPGRTEVTPSSDEASAMKAEPAATRDAGDDAPGEEEAPARTTGSSTTEKGS